MQPVMQVPLLDLAAQYAPIRDAVVEAVTRVVDTQKFILGPEVERFEAQAAAYLGARHAIGVSSGTDALLVAMMALDLGPGDEVIVPTYSFFATAGCVSRTGATPVLVDIDPVTYNLDVDAVRRAITPRTRAIVPVHLYGQAAEMTPLLALAREQGLSVIEDAAQAIGATYEGRALGTLGDFGCFSFYPSKNLGAAGDAGLVTVNDDDLAARVRLLRVHGAQRTYHHEKVGGNFRMAALQAAVLGVKLPHLEAWTEARRRNADRYRALFASLAPGAPVSLPVEQPGRRHIYNQFVIRAERRDALRDHLRANGVGCEIYYPVPFHLQPCFAYLGVPAGALPVSEQAAAETLALPIYSELTEAQQAYVVETIATFYARA
ncbi:DegT/DnrJ/EryC1/StrS aminotransferase family protein [Luteitalea sp. TBR-22]|uniref:DegT/DnrJ/EryC1/StrS family aminotransferase n=1 Tax=Luteitalea sp. TBR-22 TaxID=2802971 RepID=UPI001AF08618|nr:DegT/DnrJ/EryC1/StrS family aminotransferase [Luteitalea sp. TBR-22]